MRSIRDFTLLDVNSDEEDILINVHKLRPEIANLLIKHRPYKTAVDVLRVKLIAQRANIDELTTIMVSAAVLLPPSSPTLVKTRREVRDKDGLIVGHLVDDLGKKWAYLADNNGNEIIAAEVAEETYLDYATVRFGGINTWELSSFTKEHRLAVAQLLKGKEAKLGGELWRTISRKTEKPVPYDVVVARLSQLLAMLQDFTQSVDYEKAGKDPCTETNGCTDVPDFNFKKCCDAHDRCYCRGGDEDDRLSCDMELYNCIKSKGHPHLAAIYYWGVRNFGASHFNYTSSLDNKVGRPTTTDPSDNPSTPDCKITVSIIQVEYKGENIGNDWTYSAAVNGQSTRLLHDQTHNHGATRYFDTVIYDRTEAGRCGDSFNLILSVNATELDPISDDHGSASVSYQVNCEPGLINTYEEELEVIVTDVKRFWPDSTGRLYFLFRIETQCV
jgi:hypothetical protein